MSKFKADAEAIIRASELGLTPRLKPTQTLEVLINEIEKVHLRDTESKELLQEQEYLLSVLSLLETKGVMDEIYPEGYKAKRLNVYKKPK